MTDVLKAESTKDYLTCAAIIGIPVVLQNMVSSCINTLDVFMLGQLGETAITAASMSNQWFLLYCILTNGIASAAAIFISQYWGKREVRPIHHYMGILGSGAVGLALVFTCFSMAAPEVVISFYSMDPEVIREGTAYLRTIGVSYLLYAVNITCGTGLRSIGQTRVPMAASVISLLFNAVGNYLLIFGIWIVPRMEVQGAALATVLARIMEILITLGYILWKRPPVLGKFRDYIRIPYMLVQRFFRYGGLVILGEAVYAVGSNLYNVAYKFTGTESQASLQIIQTVQGLALLFCGGFGTAASVMLGTTLGKNEFEKARYCSRLLTLLAMAVSVVSGILVCLAGPVFLPLFQIGAEAKQHAEAMLGIMACAIPLRTLVFMIICGILRSGGDNLYCFLANVFGVWCLGIPAVFLAAMVFGLPVPVVYLLSVLEEVGKLLICGPRVLKGRWVRNLTN